MSISKKPKKLPEPHRLSQRLLARARPIASKYRIVLWHEDREWYGQGVEEPGAMGDGRTIEQCVRNVRDALTAVVASNLAHGEPVIEPILDEERRERRKAS